MPLPRIPEGFARIRLLAAGICSTDLELQRGYYGFSGNARPRIRGRSDRRLPTRAEWIGQQGRRRNQPRLRQVRMVHTRPRTPLPDPHRARHRQASRGVSRIPDAADPQPASRARSIPAEHAVFIEPLAAACEILDQVKDPQRRSSGTSWATASSACWSRRCLQAHGRACICSAVIRTKCDWSKKPASPPKSSRRSFPDAYRWVVDATGSSKACARP